jgi:hypothetical protein
MNEWRLRMAYHDWLVMMGHVILIHLRRNRCCTLIVALCLKKESELIEWEISRIIFSRRWTSPPNESSSCLLKYWRDDRLKSGDTMNQWQSVRWYDSIASIETIQWIVEKLVKFQLIVQKNLHSVLTMRRRFSLCDCSILVPPIMNKPSARSSMKPRHFSDHSRDNNSRGRDGFPSRQSRSCHNSWFVKIHSPADSAFDQFRVWIMVETASISHHAQQPLLWITGVHRASYAAQDLIPANYYAIALGAVVQFDRRVK